MRTEPLTPEETTHLRDEVNAARTLIRLLAAEQQPWFWQVGQQTRDALQDYMNKHQHHLEERA